MATKAQQKEWLVLYDSPDNYAPMGQRLKEWLCGGQMIATKAALFDLASCTAPIVSDLFGEDSYFADPRAFWTLQREAVEAKRQADLEDGWVSVELIEPGQYFQSWEYEKRSKNLGMVQNRCEALQVAFEEMLRDQLVDVEHLGGDFS